MKFTYLLAALACAAGAASAQSCPEPDGFFPVSGSCDRYIRCYEGEAKEETCPDGLLFKEGRGYPCVYPQEAECADTRASSDPQPTEDCPRQFAIFRNSPESNQCGSYTSCVNGRAYDFQCPESLAFNENSLLCMFADEVEDCDASAFLGFTCPVQEFRPDQVGEFTKVAHPSDCTKYYVCMNKEDGSVQPRLQGCLEPTVFDPAIGECSDVPEDVPGCENVIPAEVLQQYRARVQAEEDRRESRLQELRDSFTG